MNELTKLYVKQENIKLDFKGKNFYKNPLYKGKIEGSPKTYVLVEYENNTELDVYEYITIEVNDVKKMSLQTEKYALTLSGNKVIKKLIPIDNSSN